MMAQRSRRGAVLEPAEEMRGALADLGGRKVGERIKALRAQRQWSAQALADACGRLGGYTLTRSTIAKIEADLRRLQADEAVTLARAFGVTVEELLGAGVASGGTAGGGDPDDLPATSGSWSLSSIMEQDVAEQVIGRDTELNALLDGLNSTRGPHSWLVIGPPGIGKTTMLSELAQALAKDSRWSTSRVDVRDMDPHEREDAETVLTRMFGDEAAADDLATHRGIAQRISRDGKRLACLLDSAELLPGAASARVRSALSSVYRLVQETRNPAVWLTFVVASRREDGWRSVTPPPRLAVLPLAELSPGAVEERLRASAGPARAAQYSSSQFAGLTALVHGLTAGLPPLLEPFMAWIRAEEWIQVSRLEDHDVFEALAGSYIRDCLLARDSLLPNLDAATKRQWALVKDVIRVLVRYRFFTQAHVRDIVDHDGAFRASLRQAGWQADGLWAALSGMALLARPLDEPWQEFHPAIRRLLFRHFYPSAGQRAAAHEEAREFVNTWSARQRGRDQVTGLTEGLWHHAAALASLRPPGARARLLENARELGEELRESDAYTVSDLRAYAAERVIADAELQESVSDDEGLADELAAVLAGRA